MSIVAENSARKFFLRVSDEPRGLRLLPERYLSVLIKSDWRSVFNNSEFAFEADQKQKQRNDRLTVTNQ